MSKLNKTSFKTEWTKLGSVANRDKKLRIYFRALSDFKQRAYKFMEHDIEALKSSLKFDKECNNLWPKNHKRKRAIPRVSRSWAGSLY